MTEPGPSRAARASIRAASLLVPRHARAAWREEWESELAHEASRLASEGRSTRAIASELQRAARGAWRDAAAVRATAVPPVAPRRRARHWMETVVIDLRQAARALLRSPTLVLPAVATLALGIGAGTAVFSVVNGVLLRPPPFERPDRLVNVWPDHAASIREIAYLDDHARELAGVAVLSPGWLTALTGVENPTQLDRARVSANFFGTLGVPAALGRTFGPEADIPGGPAEVVLSDALWRSRFGGDATVIGRTLVLDGAPHTVIGVLPPGIELLGVRPDLWSPMPRDPASGMWRFDNAYAVARLAEGATLTSVLTELRLLQSHMRDDFDLERERTAAVAGLNAQTVRDYRAPLALLLGAVTLALLIACANVSNLLLVRAAERRRELAVRAALGASRAALARALLAESMILALAGGLAGLVLARLGTGALTGLLPADTPHLSAVSVDLRVLAACAGATLIAGLLFGGMPALFGARAGADWLRGGRTVAGGASRARGILIAAELALAFVLAVGAGIMGRSLAALYAVDLGVDTDHALTMRVTPIGRTDAERRAYWRQVLAALRATPGVAAAGTVLHLPLAGRTWTEAVEIEGMPDAGEERRPRAAWQAVSNGYFDAAGIRVLRGRDIADTDDVDAAPVAVVNDVFARAIFDDADPIGRRVRTRNATGGEWATIVGVVGSVRHHALDRVPPAEIYVPLFQRTVTATSLFVRTSTDPSRLAPQIQRSIREVDPDVPISHVQTMERLVDTSLGRPRLLLSLLGAFALLGITLGAIGIAGVVAWVVRERRREIGIRVAIGASSARVAILVARHGVLWAAAGIVAGIPAALILSRTLAGFVFGVSPADPATFVVVPAALLLVAGIAGFLPARAAARIQPGEVLTE